MGARDHGNLVSPRPSASEGCRLCPATCRNGRTPPCGPVALTVITWPAGCLPGPWGSFWQNRTLTFRTCQTLKCFLKAGSAPGTKASAQTGWHRGARRSAAANGPSPHSPAGSPAARDASRYPPAAGPEQISNSMEGSTCVPRLKAVRAHHMQKHTDPSAHIHTGTQPQIDVHTREHPCVHKPPAPPLQGPQSHMLAA